MMLDAVLGARPLDVGARHVRQLAPGDHERKPVESRAGVVTELDLSSNYTVDLNNSIAIADALAGNTHLRSLKMCSLRLTNAFAKALARCAIVLCFAVYVCVKCHA